MGGDGKGVLASGRGIGGGRGDERYWESGRSGSGKEKEARMKQEKQGRKRERGLGKGKWGRSRRKIKMGAA